MNSTFALFAALFLCLAPAYATSCYNVVKDGINIRSDSTSYSPSLGYLTKKDRLEVLAEQYDWYKIVLPKRFKGFVLGTYVEKYSEKKGKVTASRLNIRQEPSLQALTMGQLPEGTLISIRSAIGDWLEIEPYPYATGWVHKQFLKKEVSEPEIKAEVVSGRASLSSFIHNCVKRLSVATAQEKTDIQKELTAEGQYVITFLEQYLPEAEDSLVYSIIAVFSNLAHEDPTLISYFLKKAKSESPRIASVYLDTLQNVLQPTGPKKAYFYLAANDALSTEDIGSARDLFQAMYEDVIAARNTNPEP